MEAWGLRLSSRGVDAFQARKDVGVADGFAVGDVLLLLASLPVAVLLGEILAVELSEGDSFCIVVIPVVELHDALYIRGA